MYKYVKHIGYQVYGDTLGESWISLVDLILDKGKESFDEQRKRIAIQNIRFKSIQQNLPDHIIDKYGDKNNLRSMVSLMFKDKTMYDIDVFPSFSSGPKSYFQRLTEGKIIDFIIKRLSNIPESKKAVIVFPTYEDYEAVLKNQKDDYLPCIVSIQFRLSNQDDYCVLDTTFYARSIDVIQKSYGNFVAISMLSTKIANDLSKKMKKKIKLGFLDGLIADAHIYQETVKTAQQILTAAKKDKYYF